MAVQIILHGFILQQGRAAEGGNGTVPVVLTTHDINNSEMTAAITEIKSLDAVTAEPTVMIISGEG